ncbi:MAG: AtpZ/AtpI family protein [Blautia sp.]
MKKWTGMITNLTMLTQFGLSLVTPLFLCLALCWWLCDRFSVGTWIYLIGFFFGIGGGAVTAWKFGQSVLRHQKRSRDGAGRKKEEKEGVFQPTYLERV